MSAVIMVKRMQAREGRKGKRHDRAVVDLHLRPRRVLRKLWDNRGCEAAAPPSWRGTVCVGSEGEGNGVVWRHGAGWRFIDRKSVV